MAANMTFEDAIKAIKKAGFWEITVDGDTLAIHGVVEQNISKLPRDPKVWNAFGYDFNLVLTNARVDFTSEKSMRTYRILHYRFQKWRSFEEGETRPLDGVAPQNWCECELFHGWQTYNIVPEGWTPRDVEWKVIGRGGLFPDDVEGFDTAAAKEAFESRRARDRIVELAAEGDVDGVRLAVNAPRLSAESATAAVAAAAEHSDWDCVKVIKAGCQGISEWDKALALACKDGEAEVVAELLEVADPTAENHESIRAAAALGHTDVVRLLLADGRANHAAGNHEAMKTAVGKGYTEIVELLLAAGRPEILNDDELTPLELTLANILSARSPPKYDSLGFVLSVAKGGFGFKPIARELFITMYRQRSKYNYMNVARGLGIEHPVEYARGLGRPVLCHYWKDARSGYLAFLKVAEALDLLDDAVKFLNTTWMSVVPHLEDCLRIAISHGHTEIVRLLLEDGRADPGADHQWALVAAAEAGHAEIIRLLLADPRVDPMEGFPGDLDEGSLSSGGFCAAVDNGHVECIEIFLADGRYDMAEVQTCTSDPAIHELLTRGSSGE